MKQFKNQTEYFEQLSAIKLREDRKQAMREELSAYADFATADVRITDPARLPWYTQFKNAFINPKQNRMIKIALMIAVLVTTGGTTSFAAQKAVPGDTLYPIKVHVNEPVRGTFALGTNAEARHQGRLLAERIAEVETLLKRDKLTPELAAEQSARISAQAELMNERSVRAKADVQAQVKNDVVARLSALQTRLADRTDNAAVSITAGLERAQIVIESKGGGAESQSEINHSLESAINIEARAEQARDLLNTSTGLSAEARTDLRTKLDAAVDVAVEARARVEADGSVNDQKQINAVIKLIEEMETELRDRASTSVDAASQSRSGIRTDSANGSAEIETNTRLDTRTETDTDGGDIGGSQSIEGSTGVRLGL